MRDFEPTIAEDRRFNFWEAVVGVILRPVTAMRQIAAARPWPWALGLAVVIALLGWSGEPPVAVGPDAASQ